LAAMAAEQKHCLEALRYLRQLEPAQLSAPEVILLRMRALYLCGRDVEADALLLHLSNSAFSNPQLTFSAGLALASVAKYEKAEDFFSRTLEAEPGDFDVLYNLGVAAFHAGKTQRAYEVLQAALKQRPQDVDTLYNLAVVDTNRKQSADAIPLLAQAAHLDPARRDIQLTLAQTLSALGYYADAATAYANYLKLAPDDEAAQRERAFMLAICGREDLGLPKLAALVHAHPNDVTARYEMGVVEYSSNTPDAAAQLEKALALQPNFGPARFARGALLCRQGKFAAALPDLEVAAAEYPDNALVLDRLGNTYIELNRFADSEKVLTKAAEVSPRDGTVLLHLSRAYSGEGRKDEAKAALERFRALGPDQAHHVPPAGIADLLSLPPEQLYAQYRAEVESRFQKEPQDPRVNLRYLKLLVEDGRTKESADLASHLLTLHPPALLAAEAAHDLLDGGQYAEAKPLLQYAAASAPTPDVQLDLGIVLFHTDDAKLAMDQLDRVPEKQRSGDYYLIRAQILDAEGQPDAALSDLQRALNASPTRADLYEEAARFLLRRDRTSDAIHLLDEASRGLPENRQLLLLKAALYASAQRAGDAERVLKQIENRWPEWANAYVTYGILLEGQKRADEAKAQLETALALGASGAQVQFYLAKSTFSATPDRIDDAAREISQAIADSPNDPWIQVLAGRIYYEKQDYPGAIEHLQEAIRLRPNDLQARFTLAQAYRALGQREANPKADEDSSDILLSLPSYPR
jgi:tetratricopeptide (TPR) repeat protein